MSNTTAPEANEATAVTCSSCQGTGLAGTIEGVENCTACSGLGTTEVPWPSVALLAARDAIAAGYTELAEWADRHPEVNLTPTTTVVYAFASTRETFNAWTRALADGAGLAGVTKSINPSYATAVRRFGSIKVQVTIARNEVCERVVTGTRQVQVPDPEVVAAAPLVTVDEDIVEWRCPPSFLAEG